MGRLLLATLYITLGKIFYSARGKAGWQFLRQQLDGHLMNDVTNVFISHKMDDGDAAIDIKRELMALCSDRLNVFVSKEIPEGDSGLREIMVAIADAKTANLL